MSPHHEAGRDPQLSQGALGSGLASPGAGGQRPPASTLIPRPAPQENRLAQHTIQALQGELDSLRADNIKLFEKIKFLQSYPGRVRAHPGSQLRQGGGGQRLIRTLIGGGMRSEAI